MPCRITPYQKEQWRQQQEQERKREELKQRIRQRTNEQQRVTDNQRIARLEQWARRMAQAPVQLGTDQDRHVAQSVTAHRLRVLSALEDLI